jgi:hypothetical protein
MLRWCAEDVKPSRLRERVAAILLPRKKEKKGGVLRRLKRWAGRKVASLR